MAFSGGTFSSPAVGYGGLMARVIVTVADIPKILSTLHSKSKAIALKTNYGRSDAEPLGMN